MVRCQMLDYIYYSDQIMYVWLIFTDYLVVGGMKLKKILSLCVVKSAGVCYNAFACGCYRGWGWQQRRKLF